MWGIYPFLQLVCLPEVNQIVLLNMRHKSDRANEYYSMYLHRNELQEKPQYRHVCRFRRDELDAYPWRSHGQPLTMYVALAGCLFVLLVADGAALWAGFHYTSFISGYLAVSLRAFKNLPSPSP